MAAAAVVIEAGWACSRSPKSISYIVKEKAEEESVSASPSFPPSVYGSNTQSAGRLDLGGGRERFTGVGDCGGDTGVGGGVEGQEGQAEEGIWVS